MLEIFLGEEAFGTLSPAHHLLVSESAFSGKTSTGELIDDKLDGPVPEDAGKKITERFDVVSFSSTVLSYPIFTSQASSLPSPKELVIPAIR
jgi:hypothetical protein